MLKESENIETIKMTDTLKCLDSENIYFDFKCTCCNSENIRIHPIGIPIKINDCDNSDLENVDRKHMLYLNRLPTLHEAIKNAQKEDLVYICKDCNNSSFVPYNLERKTLGKWLDDTYGKEDLNLGSRV